MLSFDNILEKRIGTGFYQGKTLAIIGLIEFCDGMKFVFMSILITILKSQWDLSQTQVASLSSVFLFGILFGNLVCAFLADSIGRKITFVLFTGFSAILVYITGESTTYSGMIVLRLLFGITYGTTYTLGFVYISEVTVAKYRGRFALSLSLVYIFGKIYFVLLCFVFLDSYNSGNWQGLIKLNSIPIAISFLFSLFFMNETIRYYLNKGKFKEAFQEIEYVMKQNQQENIQLYEEEKQGLKAWSEKQQEEHLEQELHKFGVLSKEYLKPTIILWLLYILTNLQNMSIYLLMPFLFAHNNSGFIPLLNIFIVEFVFTIIIYQFIDDPKYGGRIKIIIYSAILLTISNGGLYFFKEKVIFIGLFAIKIAIRGLFSTIGIVCCESYPLYLRSQGNGIAQAVGKIGAIPSPYFLFPLFFMEPYLPFALMCLLSLLILILAITLQQDKTHKPLETLKDE